MNQPSLPPSSFALPAPHVTYEALDAKTAKKTGKTRRKRIQEWQWVDKEWSVQLSVPGSVASERKTAKAKTSDEPARAASPTIAGEVHETIETNKTIMKAPSAIAAIAGQREEVDLFRDYDVDSEGWMYGDNHFDKMTARGGLGKYTRRRAWVRKAALVERVELVGDEDRGKNSSDSSITSKAIEASDDGETSSMAKKTETAEERLRRRRRSSSKSVSGGRSMSKSNGSASSGSAVKK